MEAKLKAIAIDAGYSENDLATLSPNQRGALMLGAGRWTNALNDTERLALERRLVDSQLALDKAATYAHVVSALYQRQLLHEKGVDIPDSLEAPSA